MFTLVNILILLRMFFLHIMCRFLASGYLPQFLFPLPPPFIISLLSFYLWRSLSLPILWSLLLFTIFLSLFYSDSLSRLFLPYSIPFSLMLQLCIVSIFSQQCDGYNMIGKQNSIKKSYKKHRHNGWWLQRKIYMLSRWIVVHHDWCIIYDT